FWRKRLGKSEFVAFQASARGGVVRVRVVKDRVVLGGRAVSVARGELLVEGEQPEAGGAARLGGRGIAPGRRCCRPGRRSCLRSSQKAAGIRSRVEGDKRTERH